MDQQAKPDPARAEPAKRVAIVACMDARLDLLAALGLEVGDAHVLRNAGGVITEDVIRSLAISQRRLGTDEVVVVHHTNCGMEKLDEEEFSAELEADTGERPGFEIGSFDDVDESVRESIARLRRSPFLPNRERITGYVYDVQTGRVRGVEAG